VPSTVLPFYVLGAVEREDILPLFIKMRASPSGQHAKPFRSGEFR
jgi:hypothetical protein